ncbi:hypothetical protein [Achromobacter xylosoxidans]|uniref:hypothetical protein n=1 Tax=Alcaligenes xylosoxydans xylosoxydans TaxID=85698 RepID=UPI0006AC9591|nr:hypothetical protein [Achromobacter xylosoxidans]KOQ31140.1 hypothetical protein ABW35_00375 [Achromobacter xylosoxidans]KOQ31494.1 hypothetical protein ABW34_01005 [Achromobacter xylosoxidans]KOQ34520.1 hypothetical protein ABW36_05680 [Achromobacter xylosoxidans]KOQ44964.1 hypothetical protein ABW39_17275 [Achromobacter xylosoxidans]KOQ47137.1 hypothetical protein ABW37_00175 [Achromobacter xylosoxidans]
MPILKSFLAVWLAYWALQVVLPVRPAGDAVIWGLLLQIAFVLSVTCAFALTEFCAGKHSHQVRWKADGLLIKLALILSLVGTLALIYDKIIVQGIDYSAGLAYAREQWRRAGELRGEGVSSIGSILGYLIGSSYIIAIILLPSSAFRPAQKALIGAAAFALALVNTLLTGGRSTLILAVLFYLVARIFNGSEERGSGEDALLTRKSKLLTMILVVLSGCYFLYIFLARAEATGISVTEYSHAILAHLGLMPTDWLLNLPANSMLTSVVNLLTMGAAYFTHSFSTTVSIFDYGPQHNEATVVFVTAASMASRLRLIPPVDTDWFLTGLFPSFPGALYLQGGWGVLVLAGFAAGMLTGLAHLWFRKAPSILSFGLLSAFGCILLASPILFAADVMMFPFIIPQFFLVYIIAKLITAWRK